MGQIVAQVHCMRCREVIYYSPFQIVGRLTFLTLSLTTRIILKFVQNITSFVVVCFINTSSFKNNLNLIMFAQIFWIRRVVKREVKNVKRSII